VNRIVKILIPSERHGSTVLDFLCARFPYLDRGQWQEQIRRQRLLVGGAPAEPEQNLCSGDLLTFEASHIDEPPVDFHVQVLFADADVLVLTKPPHLPSHPSGRYFHHTLWMWLKRQGWENPSLVNRLDRETSGLVLVALNAEAARRCQRQFADRTVEKTYRALVEGPVPDAWEAKGFLVTDADAPVRKMRRFLPAGDGNPEEGEWCATSFRRLRHARGISEVEAHPLTGRTHQIRATLRSQGYPVVGDKLYGVDPSLFLRFCRDEFTEEDRRKLRVDRQALHAAHLLFRHPRDGAPMEFSAPLPVDLEVLLSGPAGGP